MRSWSIINLVYCCFKNKFDHNIFDYMGIQEEYHQWHSPCIDRDFEMLVFGYGGQPVILFPTSKGSYYENKDQGIIESARWFLENGKIKIYCPDSIDALSWYNKSVHPLIRAYNHN